MTSGPSIGSSAWAAWRAFLTAVLTADKEAHPRDELGYAPKLRPSFAAFGIKPITARGTWQPSTADVTYARTHSEAMRSDPTELYRFVWENRAALALEADAFTQVESVLPAVRPLSSGW